MININKKQNVLPVKLFKNTIYSKYNEIANEFNTLKTHLEVNPIIFVGGGKFTPPKLFYLRSSKPLTVWKNPQKYVNQFRLRRFCQIFSLFKAFF